MKKSISAILVAALMLFAFTACEQPANIWNPNGKDVVEVTIASGDTDYLVNQPFDASRYTLDILYKDGTTAQKNGNGILQMDSNMNLLAGAKTIDVTIGGYTGSLVVNYYDVDSISIATVPSKIAYDTDDTQGDISLDGISVVASYNGGKTVELNETEYAITKVAGSAYTADTKLAKTAEGETTAVTIAYKTGATTYGKEAEFGITVAQALGDGTPAEVVRIKSVALAESNENVFYGTSLSSVAFDVIGETEDGREVELTSGTHYTVRGETTLNKTGNISIEIMPVSGATTFSSQVFTNVLNVKDDLAAGFTIVAGKEGTITLAKNASRELTASDFTITAYTKSSSGATAATGGYTVTSISPKLINATDDGSIGNVTVTFTWNGNQNVKEYSADVAVTIARQ